MKDKQPQILREIRRGQDADVIELITTTGDVLLLHGHVVHADEQFRAREQAFRLLGDALRDAPIDRAASERT